jgi:hypothetical protein
MLPTPLLRWPRMKLLAAILAAWLLQATPRRARAQTSQPVPDHGQPLPFRFGKHRPTKRTKPVQSRVAKRGRRRRRPENHRARESGRRCWRCVRSLHSVSHSAPGGTSVWQARWATTLLPTSSRRSGKRPSNWKILSGTAKRSRVAITLLPSCSRSSGESVKRVYQGAGFASSDLEKWR